MTSLRLAAVVVVQGDWVVATYGFSNRLPVGRLADTLLRLDEMLVDEILVLSIDLERECFSTLDLAKRIGDLNLRTPVALGGGIESPTVALNSIRCGVERLVIGPRGLRMNPTLVFELADDLGWQSLILSLPFSFDGASVKFPMHSQSGHGFDRLDVNCERVLREFQGEVLLIDTVADGGFVDFRFDVLKHIQQSGLDQPLILFGGLNEDSPGVASRHSDVGAVAFGNLMHARELFPGQLRRRWPDIFRSA